MLGIEEGDELDGGDMEKHGLPPGFRFHPTDEELIAFYLASKVFKAGSYHGVKIAEVDLNRCEPWELPDEAKLGEREWYFFSLRVRKYPTGLRTNRATGAGYWKATGKDRQIYSASNGTRLGTKKTLVFYKGAPRGQKTNWVMHEYRLHSDLPCRNTCKDEWVLCRIIQKTGEKIKPRPFQVQTSLIGVAAFPPSPISLPPLLETTPTTLSAYCQSQSTDIIQALHNYHHQENDLESLTMNPQFVFQPDLFPAGFKRQPSVADNIFPTLNDGQLSPSSSTLPINSLSSYQPYCAGEEGLNFPHFQSPSVDSSTAELMDEIQANEFHSQKTSTFAIDDCTMGYLVDVAAGTTTAYAADHVKSSSIAREDHGCQMLY